MQEEVKKKYYSISEVAKQMNVAPSLIRFWESQFKVIKPRKNKNGVRQYTKDDINKLNTVYFLVKKKGYTLQGANDAIKRRSDTIDNTVQLMEELESVRGFLHDLKKTLNQR